ncbi:MAG: hypothetical protein R3C28_32290 [Pirellulaceae bacterium]
MNKYMRRIGMLASLLAFLLGQRSFSQTAVLEVDPQQQDTAAEAELKFIRVQRDEKEKPKTLETSISKFRSKDGSLQVDLIGAVHVADESYYRELNKRFREYDSVLYELVAPEGTRVPAGGAPSQHPVGRLQSGMKSMLELSFQLDEIDYQRANLVHADMSPEEFSKSMKDRGESFFQMMMRAMGQAAAQQAAGKQASDSDLLFAFFAKNRATRLKQVMAEQFEDLEGQMNMIEGPSGSTIISERNKKALEVLQRQIDDGQKRIAIFYGAGHLPDMAERLQKAFGLEHAGDEWLVAWRIK